MTPWRRHRALELHLQTWPELDLELGGAEPPTRAVLAKVLERGNSAWTLVEQAEAADGYEAAIARGRIPTRDRSWHDTFNVLAFINFPLAKAALHRRCLALQRARAGKPPRSREEDALTLIDEGSLLFAGSASAIAALELARETKLVAEIDRVIRAQGILAFVFGHALLEHLVFERRPIGAGVLTITIDEAVDRTHVNRTHVDRALAERITAGGFPRPQLSPTLPWPDPLVESWLSS